MTITVGIIGGTIWGNRGAEAMLVTTIGKIREKSSDAKIIIFSYLPKQDQQILKEDSITIADARPLALVLMHFPFSLLLGFLGLFRLSLPKFLVPSSAYALSQCDVLLDISGISYADGREKFLPFNILVNLPAKLMGVRVIKLSQAMGSFNNPLNRIVSRIFLPALCERIYARGKVTVSHLEDLQIKPRLWDYAPDVALLYRSEYSLSDENPALLATQIETLTQLKSEGKTIIALSPSSVVFQQMHKTGEDYLAIFLKIIRDLSSSYHYLIVPNATRESSSKMRNNDIIIIDQLRRRAERELPAGSWKRLHSVLYDINTAGSRDLLGFADVMVTSRFHGLISALSLALPVCVIGWSHKYLEILTEFGMEDFAIDYSEVDQTLSGVIQDLLDNAQDWHDKIAQRLPHVQALSQKQFDQLELDT